MKFFFSVLLIFYFISYQCSSTEKKKFLSTKFDEVNLRKGPGLQHFIIAKFLKKGVPVQVIDTFDNFSGKNFLNQPCICFLSYRKKKIRIGTISI